MVTAVAVLAAVSTTFGVEAAHATTPDLAQHIAVPAYIPTSDTASWGSLTTANSNLGFIVANEASGPGSAVDSGLQTKVNAAHSAGTKVLGYVDTGYLGFTGRSTALGYQDMTSWLVQAEQDVDRWYSFYGSSMGGIFLDDGENICGNTQTGSNGIADAYTELNSYIHANYPGSLTVLNPGISVPECYDETADILVTYEGSASDFLDPNLAATRQPPAWQLAADPNKFWSIIYSAASTQIDAVMAQSKTNNDGYVDVTGDGADGNPYDTAPTGSYWTNELADASSAGTTVPATPSQPHTSDLYSTGLVLDWPASTNSNVVGYEVYRNGLHVASVGNYSPNDSDFTDVGLTPDTSYTYTVKARGRDGLLSAASPGRTVTTDVVWGDAPGAPGSLTGTDVSANGIDLSWSASTVTNDPVAYYDIYVNGVRKATVDPSTLTARIGQLAANTAYTFTVKARSTSGAVSAASNTVSATTTNPAPLDSGVVTLDASTNTFTFSANYNYSEPFDTVFIDTDQAGDASGTPTTGYAVDGIGADFMIQNSTLYQHNTSAGTGWGWTQLSTDPQETVTGPLHTWKVPESILGTTTPSTVFNSGDSNTSTSFGPVGVTP